MKFSAVIPTLNEVSYLPSCLEAIVNQSYPFFEIIVVDGYSDDATRQIAERMGAIVALSENRSPGVQRNLGARLAKGEIVVFVDADTVVSENLLEEFSRTFSSSGEIVGVFPKLLAADGKTFEDLAFWLLRTSLKISSFVGFPLMPGACCAYRKELFLKAGGFHEDFIREDSKLSLKMKKFGRIKGLGTCYAETSSRRLNEHGTLRWLLQMFASTLPLLLTVLVD